MSDELVLESAGHGAFVAFDGDGSAVLSAVDDGGGWWRVTHGGTVRKLWVRAGDGVPAWTEVTRRALAP